MRIATVTLASASYYSQSNYIRTPRGPKQKADDHERQCWRERAHVVEEGKLKGRMLIPAQQLKNALTNAAKFLSIKVKGKGNATYSKHFAAGIMVEDDVVLPIVAADMKPQSEPGAAGEPAFGEERMCSADGRPGGSKKVAKIFPLVREWSGVVRFIVVDDTIDDETFAYHLEQAGKMIGIGRWRPEKNGRYGRFAVQKIEWSTP